MAASPHGVVWAGVAVTLVFGGASIWAAVTATDPAVAWIFRGGAAFLIGMALVGVYVFGRPSTMFVEHGNLIARTPFSVRRVAPRRWTAWKSGCSGLEEEFITANWSSSIILACPGRTFWRMILLIPGLPSSLKRLASASNRPRPPRPIRPPDRLAAARP